MPIYYGTDRHPIYLVDTVINPPLSVSSSHRQGELFARSPHGNSTKGYQLRSRGQQRPVTGVGAGPDPYVLDEHVHRRGHGRSGDLGRAHSIAIAVNRRSQKKSTALGRPAC
jgi:hypothetical protein